MSRLKFWGRLLGAPGRKGALDGVLCGALAALTLFFCWLFVGRFGIFGSQVDWISQHSVIPDYFRQLFYRTGELFPEFAPGLGGGQNIYHFSYYGLYSPVILVSYLLPFVRMGDYLMGAAVTCLAAAGVLFYLWLRHRDLSRRISFFSALTFLLAGPMIFHSARHVMFVNYMPFLCMALWGIDRYFEPRTFRRPVKPSRRGGLYTAGVFLMIMTSFYYSIGGMAALTLYGLHRYLEIRERETDRGSVPWGRRLMELIKEGARFLIPMGTAVLMSGILLIPTALALTGRQGGYTAGLSLKELLRPSFSAGTMLYSAYGVGLTSLAVTVLTAGLFRAKASCRVLAWGCGIVMGLPLFSWLLNGFLYPREKALIPFLPLLCYMTARYVRRLEKGRSSLVTGGLPYLLTIVLLYFGSGGSEYQGLLLLDGVLTAGAFLVFGRRGRGTVPVMLPVLFLLLFGLNIHNTELVESREFYDSVTDREIGEAVREALAEEPGLYRMEQAGTEQENLANINRIWSGDQYITSLYSSTYNEDYLRFRTGTFDTEQPSRNFLIQRISENPVFRRLMGVKYLVVRGSGEELPEGAVYEKDSGYRLWAQRGEIKIYRNDRTLPICYATDRLMSREEYEKLDFPYSQTALLDRAVVEEAVSSGVTADELKHSGAAPEPIPFELPELSGEKGTVSKTEEGYRIRADQTIKLSLPIPEGGVLYLQFQVNNLPPRRELSVSLEGVKNKLSAASHLYYNGNTTFTYAVPLREGQRTVELSLGKGTYEITGLAAFVSQWPGTEEDSSLCQSELQIDKAAAKGGRISGTIEVKSTGYFITSIPYDDGFQILIDGRQTPARRVNTAFLGFPIGEGVHQIEITYRAPGLACGKAASLLGLLFFFLPFLSAVYKCPGVVVK